jgi:hypothetical protein
MQQPIWKTDAGAIGTYPSLTSFSYQLLATPVLPGISITYKLISGNLPSGLTMDSSGLISGTPSLVKQLVESTFVIRAIDNFNNIRDRTFSISITGSAVPKFITKAGTIATIYDSTWTSIPITYTNPEPTNDVKISLLEGRLPPGLEINTDGLIRGYASPPLTNVNLPLIIAYVIATDAVTNHLTCLTTAGMSPGRPVNFTSGVFGGLDVNKTYYIKSVINNTTFTISGSVNGNTYPLETSTGYMTATLPIVSVGQATKRSYSFTLSLNSLNGSTTQIFSIEVINQNTPASQGGPGLPPNSRIPAIYNTRPETFNYDSNISEHGYYVLPDLSGNTYSPDQLAYIGEFISGENFNFKILGHDFDGDQLTYNFSSLPAGLTADSTTGWITGTPTISYDNISRYGFTVSVNKTTYPSIQSKTFNFSFDIYNHIRGNITWLSDNDLGYMNNGSTSIKYVEAVSDVSLNYRLIDGALPPNLSLLPTGEIAGLVSFQPESTFQNQNAKNVFTFTIEAYNSKYPIVLSQKTFTITVDQLLPVPLDTIYCKCTPDISDRQLLSTLLNDDNLIPSDFLYRKDDRFFGKATNIRYEHAYGIFANNLESYMQAIAEKNHYNRRVILGEIKTAIARDEYTGEILYEVVYADIFDNLINYNEKDSYSFEDQSNIVTPQGESAPRQIYWVRDIPLFIGEWYDSNTDLYTSYNTNDYVTSRTSGFARYVYPNSLPNMRQQVIDILGQQTDYQILPLWMTSQQKNGSTLGYTPAWVIAYCKPKSTTLNGNSVTYAEFIKYQIDNNWKNSAGINMTLNMINFELDRLTIDKSLSYNYNNYVSPPAWVNLPGASPTPDPLDEHDFYVLFPRTRILPNTAQLRK